MKTGMTVEELQKIIESAEQNITGELGKLTILGLNVTGCSFLKYGNTFRSDPPGYGCFYPKITLQYIL